MYWRYFTSLSPDPSTTTDAGCSENDVRLVNDNRSDHLDGRVEVCINRAWGTICSEGFNIDDAQVVCGSFNGSGGCTRCLYCLGHFCVQTPIEKLLCKLFSGTNPNPNPNPLNIKLYLKLYSFTDPLGSISFTSVSTSDYTAGSGPIFFTGLGCTGQEEVLVDCPGSLGVHTCMHSQDVAVICPGEH